MNEIDVQAVQISEAYIYLCGSVDKNLKVSWENFFEQYGAINQITRCFDSIDKEDQMLKFHARTYYEF